jgi:ribosomal protein L16 Arg81 hydroxylase
MEQSKPMLATLADLLAPISFTEFLEVFRSRKRLHISASNPSRAEALLSWRDIDTLLSKHMLDGNVRLMRDGVFIPPQFYTSNEGKRLNTHVFHDLLPQGVSIVVDEVQRVVPQINQLCVAVERTMGIRTNANAYLTFAKGGAFKPHWDLMDVLVLQVHGKKQWRVWNPDVPYPIERSDPAKVNASVVPDYEIQLAPGDVLFIPRGEPHAAAVSAGSSVHLTIGLLSNTGIDFIDYLRKEAAKVSLLRMDLPRHSPDEQTCAHEAALKRQLHQLIDAASMSQFLHEDDHSRSPALQTAVSGALPQMDDLLRLTLRRRVPLPDIVADGGPRPITIGGEMQRLSATSIDVLQWLFDHDPATFRQLHDRLTPRHGRDPIEAAIRELLRLGFLFVKPGE